mgnify:CR=1 FL=1
MVAAMQCIELLDDLARLSLAGHWDEIDELLDSYPEVINCASRYDESVLHILGRAEGASRLVAKCLAMGADPNRVTHSGSTPLGSAVHAGHNYGIGNEVNVRLLVEAGADLALFDETGNPPLHAAMASVKPKIVSYLLSVGADPLQENAWGDDAYAYAVWKGVPSMLALLPPRETL